MTGKRHIVPRKTRRTGDDAGFSLAEVLVATAIMLAVTGAIFALAHPQTAAALTQPAGIDMLQRARATGEILLREIAGAGSGLDAGAQRGPLIAYFAPVVPRRFGPAADAFDVARSDALTVITVADSASQTALAAPLIAGASTMAIELPANCPVGTMACGMVQGDSVVVFDREGHYDLYEVTGVSPGFASIRPHAGGATHSYAAGEAVAVATARTYYLDRAAAVLRYSDGDQADAPVIGGLAALVPAGGSLAPLPLSIFTDGPWCGDGHRRFDADLLRVRRLRIAIRVEAAPHTVRASGAAYASPGTSRSALLSVPDFEIRFDVTPRNLGVAR
jgi:hypothetical protein